MPLQQIYGMTETIMLPMMSPGFHGHQPEGLGRPATGVQARLLTETGQDTAPGEMGELHLRLRLGRQMMSGYLFDDAATAAAFRDGWFRTGDNMTVDTSGLFSFVDRGRDVFRGENVADVMALSVARRVAEEPYGIAIAGPIPRIEEQLDALVSALLEAANGLERLDREFRGAG